MSSFVGLASIGVIIVAILFGSAMLAMAAAGFLPPDHLSAERKALAPYRWLSSGLCRRWWSAF